MWNAIAEQLSETIQFDYQIAERIRIDGGDISECFQISDGEQRYFVKINTVQNLGLFEAEQENLKKLRETETVSVPEFITLGKTREHAFIILNYVPTKPLVECPSSRVFGEQLARMHKQHEQLEYGFDNDNYIGATLQPNRWNKKWGQFFSEQRIGWQLELLSEKGITVAPDNQAVVESIHKALKSHNPSPSLLHGDLWIGNVANAPFGPLCFDPASYYGDRECDVAMAELSGGFDKEFYEGYQSVYPLSERYQERKDIYNLYHILNHCNLFGGDYIEEAQRSIDALLVSYT